MKHAGRRVYSIRPNYNKIITYEKNNPADRYVVYGSLNWSI